MSLAILTLTWGEMKQHCDDNTVKPQWFKTESKYCLIVDSDPFRLYCELPLINSDVVEDFESNYKE